MGLAIFYFRLLKIVNPKYKLQCNEYLVSMRMNEGLYLEYDRKCHDAMRAKAQAEQNGMI